MEPLLSILREIDLLKNVERQSPLLNGGRRENSAEHSWHLALSVLIAQSFLKKDIDTFKAVKMALVHDLVEIYAGDTFTYADQSDEYEKELAAMNKLTSIVPGPQLDELKELWVEYEERKSEEAKFVAALDRFLPFYSNYLNEGASWRRHNVTVEQVIEKNKQPISEGLPDFWPIVERMISESQDSGHLLE